MQSQRPASSDAPRLGILPVEAAGPVRRRAEALGQTLGLPRVDPGAAPGFDLLLAVTAERLELRRPGVREGPVYADFVGGRFGYRVRRGRFGDELLVRAVGLGKGPVSVVDATAGLGRDAVLMALAGAQVTALERSPVVAAVLRDGLERARRHGAADLVVAVTERLRLVEGDATMYLTRLSEADRPEVVYLDPMFPARTRGSAVKKEMRICRLAAGEPDDADALFGAARRAARRRVVVKRSPDAAWLAGRPPHHQQRGKAVRFDVYRPRP